MEKQAIDDDYSSIVEILISMFGEVLSKDAIVTIVESCDGDLEESANVIMNITTENEENIQEPDHNSITNMEPIKTIEVKNNENSYDTQVTQNTTDVLKSGQDTMVYSQAVLSHASASTTGAIPKQISKNPVNSIEEPKEFKQILKYHAEGRRTLVFVRGPPGSGKSYMAKNLIMKIYNSDRPIFWGSHIFSSDDYFLQNGKYCYNRNKISDAHAWNQKRSYLAMNRGVSPIVIDNTNMEIWEMEPYVREGVKNGYIIVLLEPNTPWAWKANQLEKKNIHNVPAFKIERMIDKYQQVTANELLQMLGYRDCINLKPRVSRLIPEFKQNPTSPLLEPQSGTTSCKIESQNHGKDNIEEKMQQLQFVNNIPDNMCSNKQIEHKENTAVIEVAFSEEDAGSAENMAVYQAAQKHLEEIAKIENEWENGENWDDNSSTEKLIKCNEPKQDVMPQRKTKSVKTPTSENVLSSISGIKDWTLLMPDWNEINPSTTEHSSIIPVKTVSSSTCMEIGDTDLSSFKNPLKIISATPRDINIFYVSDRNKKIPEKWMLDKSTSTNDDMMMHTRCKNEEKHFNEFRKLFKYIAREDLRDIFDKCHGDVNWAVDIVLSDMSDKDLYSKDANNLSDSDVDDKNDDNDQCECIAAYNIIPNQNTCLPDEIENEAATEMTFSPVPEKRKIKKDNALSDASIQLKQQIEQNIVIADNHYSSHCLKIRKMRRGEFEEEATEGTPTAIVSENSPELDLNEPNLPSTSNFIPCEVSDDEAASTTDNSEQTISIDLCKDLMSQLDEHFGWKDMIYSNNISTKINVPVSLLNELNAIWIESLLYQCEENEKQLEIMVKQDEEFARQMASKEAELMKSGEEPGIPDLKEIMDMDFALSLYQKDVAQWRNNEPNDLAAKLTRDKLKSIFPELSPDCLSEILMAHDNNFKATVESLLVSTGRGEVMLVNNGISKFVMEKETEQRERIMQLEQETMALSEAEWPSLPETEKIDMDLVKKYREEAETHLKFRNVAHQKAQEFMRRNMTPAATFYSKIASYHKIKYEQSNSYAAASLIHLHANSGTGRDTVDLHYLHVKEAKESLDLFLDEHIQLLRNRNGPKYQKLYFITGRGLHSNGRPRIKPAVQKRLRERGLFYSESNPGLLTTRISATDRLSHQVG